MEDDNDRSAGAIIIRDVDLLEKAAAFRRNQMEPEVWLELGRAFQQWASANDWTGIRV